MTVIARRMPLMCTTAWDDPGLGSAALESPAAPAKAAPHQGFST